MVGSSQYMSQVEPHCVAQEDPPEVEQYCVLQVVEQVFCPE